MSTGATAVPMPLAVDAETVSPAVFKEESAPVVIPLAEEGAFRVGMVGLVEAGSDFPVELLHSERVLPDCGFGDVGVLVPEMCPVVSVGRVETVPPATPPESARMSPPSPPVTMLEDSAVLSVPMSPNRVRSERSQDIRDEGPVFEVSPDSSGFLMRPSGAAGQAPVACFPIAKDLHSYNDPVLGEPVAFALSAPVPGSDTPPMTYPVYMLPSRLALLPEGQSSVQTVMASAVSSRQEGWSSGVPRTLDVSWEGPFDAYASPMDTGDSPLVATGLPACPYRNYVLHWSGSRGYTSGVWDAVTSPPVLRIYQGAGVGWALISFPAVLDTTFGRGGCCGGCYQPTAGRRCQTCRFLGSL